MKQLLSSVILIILLLGCAGWQTQPSVCDARVDEYSWLCDRSEELGVSVESVYGIVFSAAATATLLEIKNGPLVERHQVCDFVMGLEDWFTSTPVISYTGFMNQIITMTNAIEDPERILLIMSILNRNLSQYQSSLIIASYDRQMLIDGMQLFIADMLCY